jgi:threonine dehydrogenase-like Zn-dependent dehydrogenase
LHPYNPKTNAPTDKFNYIVLMAPVPALVVQAVKDAAPKAIVNIFAGIPADKTAEVDLDMYIEKQCYFVGTSGSTTEDMKTVLKKVITRQLDTNLSVAAVSGLEGAIDGIHAVEKNTMPGKILVYPSVKGMKLTAIPEIIGDRTWDLAAEKAVLSGSKLAG